MPLTMFLGLPCCPGVSVWELREASSEFDPIGGPDAWTVGCRIGRRIMDSISVSQNEFEKRFVKAYLNAWRSRFPGTHSEALLQAVRECAEPLRELPDNIVELKSSHLAAVKKAFRQLSKVERVGGTTASKTLSALAPAVCVIWDRPIAEFYGFAPNAPGYCRFLWSMSEVARDICQRHSGRVDGRAAKEVESLATPERRGEPLPLAKLLDEWNWVHITNAGKA